MSQDYTFKIAIERIEGVLGKPLDQKKRIEILDILQGLSIKEGKQHYDEGYEVGYDDGHSQGSEEGYDEGYEDGRDDEKYNQKGE